MSHTTPSHHVKSLSLSPFPNCHSLIPTPPPPNLITMSHQALYKPRHNHNHFATILTSKHLLPRCHHVPQPRPFTLTVQTAPHVPPPYYLAPSNTLNEPSNPVPHPCQPSASKGTMRTPPVHLQRTNLHLHASSSTSMHPHSVVVPPPKHPKPPWTATF